MRIEAVLVIVLFGLILVVLSIVLVEKQQIDRTHSDIEYYERIIQELSEGLSQSVDKLESNIDYYEETVGKLNADLNPATNPVCTTPECVLTAAALMEAMDLSADPCEDFFQFACGGWVEKNPVPDGYDSWNQFTVLTARVDSIVRGILEEDNDPGDAKPVQQARDMYSACMNTANEEDEIDWFEPPSEVVSLLANTPVLNKDWDEGSFDWQNASATIRLIYDFAIFVDIQNGVNFRNTSFNVIYIDQGSLSDTHSILVNLTDAQVKEKAKQMAKIIKTYCVLLGTNVTDEQIESDARDVVTFESSLAQIMNPQEERTPLSNISQSEPLSELQDWTDRINVTNFHAQISWSYFLNAIYQEGVGIEIPDDEEVIVVEREYLKNLVQLLDATGIRVIANYISWRWSNYFNSIPAQQKPRWKICVDKVNDAFGMAVGSVYVRRHFSSEIMADVSAMVDHWKTAFKSLIDEATWMDLDTKSTAIKKIDAMKEFVGYPVSILNRTALENYYAGLEIGRSQHTTNNRNIKSFFIKKKLKSIRENPDLNNTWIVTPVSVNAYYVTAFNSITFPAALLQTPFYGNWRMAAVNYGAIGGIIGHEITHGFDDEGHQAGINGEPYQWWSDESLAEYHDRAQCFIDQYSQYYPPSLNGTALNGANTLGENLADNGGLRQAYRAYRNFVAVNGEEKRLPGLEKYSAEQVFFIAFANANCGTESKEGVERLIANDPHSPSFYVVTGSLSNSQEFSQHFQCSSTNRMNRANKCILW